MSAIKSLALLALATGLATAATGKTTRYWDCCKGSCSWKDKASLTGNPVTTCDANDSPISDPNAASACNGGSAYMCSNQSPWAVSDTLAYGFAAVNIAGGSENSWCCSCYKLTFTSTSIAGKTMIVQATNTGGDLGANQFDLAIPGGGVGIFNACSAQWGAPSSGWGAQYGGISSDTCSAFPKAMQAGCGFRFDWFEGADNPDVEFERVACPKEITARTGCVRSDDGAAAVADVAAPPASSAVASLSAAAVVASSSSVPEIATSSSSESVDAATTPFAAAASSPSASDAASSPSSYDNSPIGPSVAAAASSSTVAASSSVDASSAYGSTPTPATMGSYTSASLSSSSSASAVSSSSSSSSSSSAVAAAAASGTTGNGSSDDAACGVQYVYEYDL